MTSINTHDVKQALKAEAHRLGFHLVGFTSPDPPEHFSFYENWLSSGFHGEMEYLARDRARERRADLQKILPDCESVLCLGFPYAPQTPVESDARGPTGRVASYAWGKDYHNILPEKLRALVAFLETSVGHPVSNRWYTDTGPILERDIATRSGLGWIGKNTCLINPQSGSYFLLAEILLGFAFEPDLPFTADHCGSCTRCIDACPTKCILPDRTLDAARCISYLTIELKGSIPVEMRPQTGDWVFGCDACQEVCPWNVRFSIPEGTKDFSPQPGIQNPFLLDELVLTPEAFNTKFKGSPIKRAKRRGYLRNIAVALGNTSDPNAVRPLSNTLLHENEPLVRGHAAWALGQISIPEATATLRTAQKSETDPQVLEEIHLALKNHLL